MKYLLALLAAILVVNGCSSPPKAVVREEGAPAVHSSSPFAALKAELDALLPDSLFPPSNASIKIVSVKTGESLYELNPNLLLTPASNEKLFTTAAALCELGEGFPLTTRLFADSSDVPTVYVKGGGDPLLSTADIDSMAAVLTHRLSPATDWWIAGDVSLFDELYWGRGWSWDEEPDPTIMFITPLSVNANTIEVRIAPGRSVNSPAAVTTDPPTGYVSIENTCITGADTATRDVIVSRKWKERSNVITVDGTIPLQGAPTTRKISLWQPEYYGLTLLRERLLRSGIPSDGIVLDTVSPEAGLVYSCSHRLDSVVIYMDKVSDNLAAENILKILGAQRYGAPGTAAGGLAVVRSFLARNGIDTTSFVLADGSGVSRYNLTSAAVIVRLLRVMYLTPAHFSTFYNSLPVAGEYGLLSRRMKDTPAEHNLRGKTGTMNGVSCLSGYVTTADGELLAYSMIMENFPKKAQAYRQVQDRIGIALSEWRRSRF